MNWKTKYCKWSATRAGFYVSHCSPLEMPYYKDTKQHFSTFYRVQGHDASGPTWIFLAKGHEDFPKRIFAFYTNGRIWYSSKLNLEAAIIGAMADSWRYMDSRSDDNFSKSSMAIYEYYMLHFMKLCNPFCSVCEP